MPRKSLPAKIKSLQGFNVILMHTTEEEIKIYINIAAKKFEEYFDLINARQNSMLKKVIEENPYTGLSFRKPIEHLDFSDWMGNDKEKWFSMMKLIIEFSHDFAVCVEVFKWEEPEIAFMIERYGNLGDKEKEFNMFEKLRAKQARDEWKIRDAEWIKENLEKEKHKNHKSKAEWEIEFKKIEEEMGLDFLKRWFPEGIPNTEETCVYCINKARQLKEAEEYGRQMEQENQKKDEEWKKQKESERTEMQKMTCECCNFSTFSDEAYEMHMESKEHEKTELFSSLFCKHCEIQFRNKIELNMHNQTKKHKYAAGILEKQTEFHCEKCEYKTNLKQNFDKHCLTKSHIEKV